MSRWAERIFLHLSRGCTGCWGRLERFADLAIEFHDIARDDPMAEVVLPAVARLVDFNARENRGLPETSQGLRRLRSAHRLALEEARTREFGFARLVLEEAHEQLLIEPHSSPRNLQRVRELLHRLGVETGLPRAFDLEAVALTYLGDYYTFTDDLVEVGALIPMARQTFALGSKDPEIAALIEEHDAALLSQKGLARSALDRLHQAERLLEGHDRLRTRLAEVLARQGSIFLRLGSFSRALVVLERGFALLPEDHNSRLRTFFIQNLASAHVQVGQDREAVRAILAHQAEYEHHATPLIQAQCSWTLGLAFENLGEFKEAELCLRLTISRLLEAGFGCSALLVILDLGRVYARAGWWKHSVKFWESLEHLWAKPSVGRFLLSHLDRFMKLGRHYGVDDGTMKEWLLSFVGKEESSPQKRRFVEADAPQP